MTTYLTQNWVPPDFSHGFNQLDYSQFHPQHENNQETFDSPDVASFQGPSEFQDEFATERFPGFRSSYSGPTSGNPAPGGGYAKPISSNQGPTNGNQGPTNVNQGPTNVNQGPYRGYPGPTNAYPMPVSGNLVPISGYPGPSYPVEDFRSQSVSYGSSSVKNAAPRRLEKLMNVYRQGFSPAPVTYFLPWLLSTTLVNAATRDPAMTRLKTIYQWQQMDFEFASEEDRRSAIASKRYVPANNLPLGLEVWEDRIFVTLPRWKEGIPATLATVPKIPPKGNTSPLLKPFPNWSWHTEGNCDGLTSVFRLAVDPCGRLWVIDSGIVDAVGAARQICPAKIVVFDLRNDKLLWRYEIPASQIKDGSLFTNIAVDVREGRCDDAIAYIADVWRFAIVAYSWREDRSWRVSHHLFFPDPIASEYSLHGLDFRWTDGVFGLALGPYDPITKDRNLYFHPMSSYREFSVPTSILRNETGADDHPEAFRVLGEPRGDKNYHSSASGMDRNGILFYNLVTQDAVGCWNSNNPAGYLRELQGTVDKSNVSLVFPNDLKIDLESRQSVWVLSNKLHDFLYRELDPKDVNFRILTAYTDDAVRGTVCDSNRVYRPKARLLEDASNTLCPGLRPPSY